MARRAAARGKAPPGPAAARRPKRPAQTRQATSSDVQAATQPGAPKAKTAPREPRLTKATRLPEGDERYPSLRRFPLLARALVIHRAMETGLARPQAIALADQQLGTAHKPRSQATVPAAPKGKGRGKRPAGRPAPSPNPALVAPGMGSRKPAKRRQR